MGSRPHYFYRRGYDTQAIAQLSRQYHSTLGRLDLTLEQAALQIGCSKSVLNKLAQDLSISATTTQKIKAWIERNAGVSTLQAVG
jgi:hypothetical protein